MTSPRGVCSRCGESVETPVGGSGDLCARCAAAEPISDAPRDPLETQYARLLVSSPDATGGTAAPGRRRIGPYDVIEELGRGGQAVVYLARDTRIPRDVALKVLATDSGMASFDPRERFAREAEAAARVNHPGICGVHDVGAESGIVYIAMRYVAGQTLAQLIAAARSPSPVTAPFLVRPESRDAVDRFTIFFEAAARALHAAHDAGVVHRDVKPGNVMVTPEGKPVILDFGLARDLHGDSPTLTRTGDLFGTPAYMAPEQLAGDPKLVDRRTDVYSLGVTMYEALTGHLPYDAPTRERLYDEIRLRDPIDPRQRNPAVTAELKAILEMALEKEPNRRYESALDLAEDLRRFRGHETIRARAVGPATRMARWSRRNPALAVSTAALFVALAGGIAVTLHLLARTENARRELVAEKARTELESYVASVAAAASALREHDVVSSRKFLLDATPRLRQWEWHHLWNRLDRSVATIDAGKSPYPQRLALSPDDRRIAAVFSDSSVGLWDVDTGRSLWRQDRGADPAWGIAYSPDRARIATGQDDGSIRLWDARNGHAIQTLDVGAGKVYALAFSRDGRWLASAHDRSIRIWNASTLTVERTLEGHTDLVTWLEFASDGRLASSSYDRTARIWDPVSGETRVVFEGHADFVWMVAFSADGRRLVTASSDRTARVWDAASGHCVAVLSGHTSGLWSASFHADGRRVLTAAQDGTVRLWDPATLESCVLAGHSRGVFDAVCSSDGSRIVSCSSDGTLKVWDVSATVESSGLVGHSANVDDVAFSPDGRTLASCDGAGGAILWDVESSDRILTISGSAQPIANVDFSPDGRTLATGSWDHTVRLWDVESGDERARFDADAEVVDVTFGPDGRLVVTSLRSVILLDRKTIQRVRAWRIDGAEARCARIEPTRNRVWAGSADGMLRCWDTATGSPVFTIRAHRGEVASLTFRPGGGEIATGGDDGLVRLWRLENAAALGEFAGHSGPVTDVVFDPSGSRLASVSHDRTVKIWDVDSRLEVLTLRGHPEWAWAVAWSPDGRSIASGGARDPIVRLWEIDSPSERQRAADRAAKARETVEPNVDRVLAETRSAHDVIERLRADRSLDEPLRSAAIRLARRRLQEK
ncbi:MAG: protein kinase [Planctomycetes bacterium]|nr:protein kinase [Planctomycetota bacterium]